MTMTLQRLFPSIAASFVLVSVAYADSDPSESPMVRPAFEIGVRLGVVEQGARTGVDADDLVARLVEVKRIADAAGGAVFLEGIDELIAAMEGAQDSRSVHAMASAFRKRIAARFPDGCRKTEASLPSKAHRIARSAKDWEGVWETNWGTITFAVRDDGGVEGRYGSLNWLWGEADPDNPRLLRGRWHHFNTTSKGRITFELTGPESFRGGWNWNDAEPTVGTGWTGTLAKAQPEMLVTRSGRATVAEVNRKDAATVLQWMQKLRITNVSGEKFFIFGYALDSPFVDIQTRAPDGTWTHGGTLYCGTGAGFHAVPDGKAFTATAVLEGASIRREFRIAFTRYHDAEGKGHDRVFTPPFRLELPPKGARG